MPVKSRNRIKAKIILRSNDSRPACLGVSHPSGDPANHFSSIFTFLLTVAGLPMWGVLSDERMGL
jgi:hypothetical protein